MMSLKKKPDQGKEQYSDWAWAYPTMSSTSKPKSGKHYTIDPSSLMADIKRNNVFNRS
jgi:hypothetical protein